MLVESHLQIETWVGIVVILHAHELRQRGGHFCAGVVHALGDCQGENAVLQPRALVDDANF